MDREQIEHKVRDYLKKVRMSVSCVLVGLEIANEDERYIEVVVHLQCKRTRKIRKVRIVKSTLIFDIISFISYYNIIL